MSELEDFIERVRDHRQSLMHNVNTDTFASWSSFFGRPHVNVPNLLGWCIIGFVFGFASFFWTGGSIGLALGSLPYMAIGLAASVGAAATYYYGIAWPRTLWLARWKWQAPAWVRLGWAPAALILPWFAVALSQVWWSMLIVAPVAIGIALWSLATGERDTREGGWGWHARALMIQGYLLLWWLLMTVSPSEAPSPHLTMAVLAASVASFAGAETLAHAWSIDWPPLLRVAGLGILALLVVAAGVMIGLVGDRPEFAPLSTAAVAVAVSVHRTMAYGLSERPGFATARHYVMWFGALLVFGPLAIGSSIPLVVRGGLLLLLGVSFVLVVSLLDEVSSAIGSRRNARQA